MHASYGGHIDADGCAYDCRADEGRDQVSRWLGVGARPRELFGCKGGRFHKKSDPFPRLPRQASAKSAKWRFVRLLADWPGVTVRHRTWKSKAALG